MLETPCTQVGGQTIWSDRWVRLMGEPEKHPHPKYTSCTKRKRWAKPEQYSHPMKMSCAKTGFFKLQTHLRKLKFS
jgi:hypothetical protein